MWMVLSDFFDFMWRKKFRYFLFFIQMLVIFLIVQFTFSIIYDYKIFQDKLNEIKDSSSTMYFVTQKRGSKEYPDCSFSEYEAFQNEVAGLTSDTDFSFGESDLFLTDKRIPEKFVKYSEKEAKLCEVTYISERFLGHFRIETEEGELFHREDYQTERTKYIPILLGYDYREYFKVGDILDEKYEVKGILKEDSAYFNTGWESALIYLDKQIILPMLYQAKEWGGCFVNHLNFSLKQEKETDKILQVIEDYGFKDFIVKNRKAQLEYFHKNFLTMFSFMVLLFFTVTILCIFSMVSMLAHLIEEYKQEFGIYMLCGASKFHICVKISLPIIISIFFSAIPSLLISKSFYHYLLQIAMILILNFMILFFPLLYWLKKPISELKKERK